MRNALIVTSLVFVNLALNGTAFAATLWQKAEVGMSSADVKRIYPQITGPVQAPDHLVTSNPPTFSSSPGKTVMVLNDIIVFCETFHATFRLTADRLDEVDLAAASGASGGLVHEPPETIFLLLKDELTKRYGNPVKETASQMLISQTIDFLNNGTSVELILLTVPIAAGQKLLSVSYKPAQGTGENPL